MSRRVDYRHPSTLEATRPEEIARREIPHEQAGGEIVRDGCATEQPQHDFDVAWDAECKNSPLTRQPGWTSMERFLQADSCLHAEVPKMRRRLTTDDAVSKTPIASGTG